jgi:hypothetical protein
METITWLSIFIAIAALVISLIAKKTVDKLERELYLFRRQFDEQIGKLLHETPDERQVREAKESEKRIRAENERKSLSVITETDELSPEPDPSPEEEIGCYEKGASPGGGCVGK